jgi:hypothetical protein
MKRINNQTYFLLGFLAIFFLNSCSKTTTEIYTGDVQVLGITLPQTNINEILIPFNQEYILQGEVVIATKIPDTGVSFAEGESVTVGLNSTYFLAAIVSPTNQLHV